jgi:hypothetical protein
VCVCVCVCLQVEAFAEVVRSDPRLAEGFDAIGYSQVG